MKPRLSTLSLCLFFTLIANYGYTQERPKYLLVDETILMTAKKAIQPAVKNKITSLIKSADSVIDKGPYSVTFQKTKMAPTNDPHDYVSQAPYWWADPSKPDGKPYIRKDGKRNPEIYLLHDRSQLGDMSSTVKKLALAYYYSNNEKYALRAETLLRVWFVNPETRMNPNLNFGQYVPGVNEGRGIGIIETVGLINIPDAIALLQGSKIDPTVVNDVKKWFASYTDWLLNSENGKSEQSQTNNHGTNYDLQVADFALFTGNTNLAKHIINDITIPRINVQFTPEGAQPLELARTKSWDYTNMNLDAWAKIAMLSKRLGVDLWNKEGLQGKGIKGAVKWLIPYASGEKAWTTEQIGPYEYGNMCFIMRKSSEQYKDLDFSGVFKKYPQGIALE
ncbi:alginate lyase family protein [Pedobacter duraquae]|uniref:Alginate lyase n=1 Tax=Pedobacter duraquae TaxID=425511 RepID=A0A4R6IMT0_9SPHI|nr:alginate lyase family protein [Pedobacter duraquae]TDO23265.1 alginate lyase [Pedobacter duraquae]